MSLSSTTLFSGAAIFGTIGLIWNKIKFIFSRILNLFIVTVKIDGDIPQAMQIYLINNFKKSPLQPLSFSTFHDYIKSTKKRCIIGYEELNLEDKIIFWKNWKPLIISSNKNNNSPTSPSNSSNNIKTTLSFIRGTFNINNLIIEALELLNIKKLKMIKFLDL